MAAEKTARFSIQLDGDSAIAASGGMAASLGDLQKAIKGSQDKIKGMGAALRNLKGGSDEVKAAKDRLKAAIGAEKDALSAATLEALKHGDALGKAEGHSDAFGRALGAMKGPLLGAAALASAATLAVVGLAVGFGKLLLETANARRDMALTNEAFAGSAANGKNLTDQVDLLASKVPLAKDKLNDLSNQLLKTRLSGQAIVDTMNIVGVASSAMGDDVGKTLEGLITRGAMWNRFRLNPIELQGTGIMAKDVAGNLAKNLHISMAAAQRALFEGRVKLEDGAKALRQTVEKRFGEVNAKKMLSLGVQWEKFKESFGVLTKNVDLDPLLSGISKIGELFSTNTVAGKALQDLFTSIGKTIGKDFGSGLGGMVHYVKLGIMAAIKLDIAYLTLRKSLKEAFAPEGAAGQWIAGFKVLIDGIKKAVMGVVHGVEWLAKAYAKITGGGDLGKEVGEIFTGGKDIGDFAAKARAAGLGGGEVHSTGGKKNELKGYADGGIVPSPKSPDSVFVAARPGERIIPPGQGGGGGAVTQHISVPISFQFHGGGHGSRANVSQQLADAEIVMKITKAVEDACKSMGIPTMSEPIS